MLFWSTKTKVCAVLSRSKFPSMGKLGKLRWTNVVTVSELLEPDVRLDKLCARIPISLSSLVSIANATFCPL